MHRRYRYYYRIRSFHLAPRPVSTATLAVQDQRAHRRQGPGRASRCPSDGNQRQGEGEDKVGHANRRLRGGRHPRGHLRHRGHRRRARHPRVRGWLRAEEQSSGLGLPQGGMPHALLRGHLAVQERVS